MFERLFRRGYQRSARSTTPALPKRLDHLTGSRVRTGLRHVVDADRIVVVDTETTGLYSSDRVLEVAAVTFDPEGTVIDEWDTLVNPRRDVGPTWLHGITPSMVADAPSFEDVAASLATRMHGAVVVAHNLPFDARLLCAEYARLGASLDVAVGIDTLRLRRCKLDVACEQLGIERSGAHQALNDARATGELLFRLAQECQGRTAPARFLTGVPSVGPERRRPRVLGESYTAAPPTWLAGLAATLRHDAADLELVGYLDVLNLAMADLHLDQVERNELLSLAATFGLSDAHIALAHRRWLDDLLAAATADGVVDEKEYHALCRAAAVLGIEQSFVDGRTARHRSASTPLELRACTVCFTGEPVDSSGRPVPRGILEQHARNIGLTPVPTVTRSGCQLLVAADPQSMSGKAAKARQFGIPIVSGTAFLETLHGDTLLAQTVVVEHVDTHVCTECGRAWTKPRSRGPRVRVCGDCRRVVASRSEAVEGKEGARAAPPAIEVLRCGQCGCDFERIRTRGRKPGRCPGCR